MPVTPRRGEDSSIDNGLGRDDPLAELVVIAQLDESDKGPVLTVVRSILEPVVPVVGVLT